MINNQPRVAVAPYACVCRSIQGRAARIRDNIDPLRNAESPRRAKRHDSINAIKHYRSHASFIITAGHHHVLPSQSLTTPSLISLGRLASCDYYKQCMATLPENLGPDFQKNLRKNPKFSVSFSYVYVKFIESYKVKIFTEF